MQIQRDSAVHLFQAGIAAADPYRAVQACLTATAQQLEICLNLAHPWQKRIGHWPRIHLLALGKAACAMTAAALEIIPPACLQDQAIVITNEENVQHLDRAVVYGAGHPLPNAAGLHAAQVLCQKAASAKADELVLVLVSGGGSALLPAPVNGLSLDDKIQTTQLLLASGASINEVNCVRKHLSTLKGGGLARMAAPAAVHALILSDVLGDDLSAIASGPTVPDHTTFAAALQIIDRYQLGPHLPAAVQQVLNQGNAGLHPETPKPQDTLFQSNTVTLCGSNALSLSALQAAAAADHYPTLVYNTQLAGEARLQAEQLAHFVHQHCLPQLSQPLAVVAGGETTVTLTGTGLGGRNQEFALAFALAAEKLHFPPCWTLLSAGTDGRDGPTDAAGGIVDASTLTKIRAQGLDAEALLRNNDSYTALNAADALLITGSTGTNVADLLLLLLHPLA